VTLVTAVGGFAVALIGVLAASTTVIAVGGVAVSLAGLFATTNLATGPRRVRTSHARGSAS